MMHVAKSLSKPQRSLYTPRPSSGLTLIEIVVSISMLGTIFTLSGIAFHLLLKSEKVVSQSFVTERSISRLAVQFRDDVHRSASAKMTDGSEDRPEEMLLAGSNESGVIIRYRVTKDGLARFLVNEGKIEAREDFRLPDCLVRFRPAGETESDLVALIIDRPSATPTRHSRAPRPLRPLEIQASINRHGILVKALTSNGSDHKVDDEPAAKEDQ